MTGLYIHIPFCLTKCNYCDFLSYTGYSQLIPVYIDALIKEASEYAGFCCDSVFIGGGTPSCIDSGEISRLMNAVSKYINISSRAEISIEANPNTLTLHKCVEYIKSGINRMSIGLQSANDSILKTLGRTHTLSDFLTCVDYARQAGFSNINADIMLGLPGQTIEDVADTVSLLKDFEHVSAYSLKIEQNTLFHDMYENDEFDLPCEDTDREFFRTAAQMLSDMNFSRYEISNFAKANRQCTHNLKYWQLKDYVGLGVGAHSCLSPKRHSNEADMTAYLNGNFQREYFPLEHAKETVMLGIRTIYGVDANLFSNRNCIDELVDSGLAVLDAGRLILTDSGFDVSNSIILKLWDAL